MATVFADPFEALLRLQRALEARTGSGWLENQTASQGSFPPINVFQQGDDILAVIELPGIDTKDLQVQAKENTIRISGKKLISYPEGSVHRRERVFGEFDRTLSLPVQLDPDGSQLRRLPARTQVEVRLRHQSWHLRASAQPTQFLQGYARFDETRRLHDPPNTVCWLDRSWILQFQSDIFLGLGCYQLLSRVHISIC